MKKTFLTKRNALLSSTGVSWGAIALAFAVAVLLMRLLVPNVFWYAVSPFLRISDALADKSHALVAGLNDTSLLAVRNEELADENTALANENQALLKQVQGLSDLLGSPTSARRPVVGILASVAARPPVSPYDTLLVNAGSDEGVTPGMEVFGIGGVPLGVAFTVAHHYSRVTLFSAPRMTTNGWVGSANLAISIRGEGAGAMSASVARAASVKEGDMVYAPGPGMLPIGRVARVDSDPSSPSVTLRIQPVLNLFTTAWVMLRDTGAIPLDALSSATSTLP